MNNQELTPRPKLYIKECILEEYISIIDDIFEELDVAGDIISLRESPQELFIIDMASRGYSFEEQRQDALDMLDVISNVLSA